MQDIAGAIVGPDKQANIKITPAHKTGYVAPRHLQRSDVAEDLRPLKLPKECGRFYLQRRLSSRKLLIAGCCSHDRRC